ncbi:hypothetical protein FIV42_24350 [Persicimonas caeni]|uniref:Uncharacterized protein n=1 Tax=Persicimonas caeni TaxID=2292766 RepID=A0A4Y6PZT7_PERCE|nr:hypothetical protein [Persicimonas caeni]QDG53760.1 hypothetical protein FIV42_24350 [Persicimonas caeni]QED34981.1 hypothetical protein FRD00_24345 [Persicimonas caeni]
MDPIIVLIITLIALSGGGAGSAAVMIQRRKRQLALREAVLEKVDHAGRPLSLFDVFWDLGVSDYALALMDHHGILPRAPQDFEKAHSVLDDLIEAHGTYTDFLEDNLAAIQEFYRDHRQTGHRRKIPTLTVRDRKLLPGGRRQKGAGPKGDSTALVRKGEEMPAVVGEVLDDEEREQAERELGLVVHGSVDDRRVSREDLEPLLMTVSADEQMPIGRGVDVDEASKQDWLATVKNIFDGRLTDELKKWWEFRSLRAAKSRLDEQFAKFYDFYADLAGERPDFYEMLYDTTKRWRGEADRIDDLLSQKPWRREPFADCAEVLVFEARRLANQLAHRAKRNVDDTVERIHEHARDGDKAMAGYLLYLNHHAFFAGRAPQYGKYVERIERQAYRVQEELRKLKKEGQL